MSKQQLPRTPSHEYITQQRIANIVLMKYVANQENRRKIKEILFYSDL